MLLDKSISLYSSLNCYIFLTCQIQNQLSPLPPSQLYISLGTRRFSSKQRCAELELKLFSSSPPWIELLSEIALPIENENISVYTMTVCVTKSFL